MHLVACQSCGAVLILATLWLDGDWPGIGLGLAASVGVICLSICPWLLRRRLWALQEGVPAEAPFIVDVGVGALCLVASFAGLIAAAAVPCWLRR